MTPLTEITPFLLVPDLAGGIAFWTGLGFHCANTGSLPGFAYLRAPFGAVRLLEQKDMKRGWNADFQQMVYLDVADVDAMFETLRPFLDTLSPENWTPPADMPHGQREFHVWDDGATMVFFGAAMR